MAEGFQWLQQGDVERATAIAQQLLTDPTDPVAGLQLLAAIAHQQGQVDAALAYIGRALTQQPNNPDLYNNLGNVLKAAGQWDAALPNYQQAIALRPDFAEAHYNLGTVYQERRDLESAKQHYWRAIALRPNFAAAHHTLAIVLRQQNQHQEALTSHQQAIALDPNYAPAHDSLGTTLLELGQLADAIQCHQQAIATRPNFATAHYNLAIAYRILGQIEPALASYDRAIAANPDYADAHVGRAITLLLAGRYPDGFSEYEWRWQAKTSPIPFPQPQWDGSALKKRPILLFPEQGFGDVIQFIRYAPLVAARGGRVIALCRRPLERLLATVPGITRVIGYDPSSDTVDLPDFHCYSPLISLPRLLDTTLDTIPADIPYLSPPADSTVSLTADPAAVKIGFVWRAGGASSERYPHRRRSCQLTHYQPLIDGLTKAGVACVSLQVDVTPAEQAWLGQHQVQDLSRQLRDFGDTAAAIAQLDLLISVDTAAAHLGGAMGKPVWVMLPIAPDWRWLLHRSDSPWYPTLRLFRQTIPGDWVEVLGQISRALSAWLPQQQGDRNPSIGDFYNR